MDIIIGSIIGGFLAVITLFFAFVLSLFIIGGVRYVKDLIKTKLLKHEYMNEGEKK